MQLQHLKHDKCPVCGARIVAETQSSRHCNGDWFESQTFECRMCVAWVPNYGGKDRYQVTSACPHSPAEEAKKEKRAAAKEAIRKFVDGLDVDQDWKDRAHADIRFYD